MSVIDTPFVYGLLQWLDAGLLDFNGWEIALYVLILSLIHI